MPALNLVMGVPLRLSAGTSGFVLSIVDSSAVWVYINKGAVLAIIAAPSVIGMMLGAFIGARLLTIIKASSIRQLVIVLLLAAGTLFINPLAAMLVLLVGFELAGIVGALFAVPLAGIVWVFASTAIRGLTFSSSASRQASTASRRRSVDSGDQDAAAVRASLAWSGWFNAASEPDAVTSTSR